MTTPPVAIVVPLARLLAASITTNIPLLSTVVPAAFVLALSSTAPPLLMILAL